MDFGTSVAWLASDAAVINALFGTDLPPSSQTGPVGCAVIWLGLAFGSLVGAIFVEDEIRADSLTTCGATCAAMAVGILAADTYGGAAVGFFMQATIFAATNLIMTAAGIVVPASGGDAVRITPEPEVAGLTH